jgi:GTPase SAR1 family protein
MGADFLETSAKTRVNVDEAFQAVIRKILAQQPGEE